jgi:epoxyqueuosine reductase QueG
MTVNNKLKTEHTDLHIDEDTGFKISSDFERFNQINDMFSRAFWDDSVRTKLSDAFFDSHRVQPKGKKAPGFRQKDFALRNAAWAISDTFSNRGAENGTREGFQSWMECEAEIADEKLHIENVQEYTIEFKQIAKLFGADLIGITALDKRWHYSKRVDTREFIPVSNELPGNYSHVIVMGHAMDKDLVDTYPSALASSAAGFEYSHEAAIVTQLTTYIRSLGYEALGSMNDTALVVPYAIQAGLGEYGRNQMVITPEFGPRVRFSKIFTNMPLTHDKPVNIGITKYCTQCDKCAVACPPKALPLGPPSTERLNQSTIKGVKKWSADCEKCFGYWTKIKTDCAICMRVCPFNRDFETLSGKLFMLLVDSPLQFLALWWEKKKGIAKRVKPDMWWQSLLK